MIRSLILQLLCPECSLQLFFNPFQIRSQSEVTYFCSCPAFFAVPRLEQLPPPPYFIIKSWHEHFWGMQASWLLDYTLILIYLICFLLLRFRLQSLDTNAMTWVGGVCFIHECYDVNRRVCYIYMNAMTWTGVCVIYTWMLWREQACVLYKHECYDVNRHVCYIRE